MYMFPQNCLNIEDGVENQQILNTVSSLGDAEIQRLVCSTTDGIIDSDISSYLII